MKTNYIKPETNIIELDCTAVICASGNSIFNPIIDDRNAEED